MAGTVTKVEITHTSLKEITWDWTSTGGGAADLVTTNVYDGKIVGLGTVPHATAPDPNYDVTVTNSAGLDVLLGAGANRHTTSTEYVDGSSLGGVAGSVLTVNITNAGGAKKGKVVLWIR